MKHHPRVLHVGFNRIGSRGNTGVTLEAMFADWPRDNLFELYTRSREDVTPHAPRLLVAPLRIAPLDGMARGLLGNRIPAPSGDGLNNSISRRGSAAPLGTRLRLLATTVNDVGPVVVRGKWLAPVEDYRPEVIHTLLGGLRIARLVLGLSRRLDIPVVPHFMDDWLGNLYSDGQLFGIARAEVERTVAAVMRRAPIALTIGEDMRSEYEARLHVPCVVVGNSVALGEYQTSNRGTSPQSNVPILRYIGGLHLGRDQALAQLAEVLQRRSDSGSFVRLVVHSPISDAERVSALVSRFPRVVEAGATLSAEEIPNYLASSQVLVFVESSLPEIFRFTRLSVSTKVPEYIAARRPILALGPADQASIRALKLSPLTRFADEGDGPGIASAVEGALVDAQMQAPPLSQEMVDMFDRKPTQERLRSALSSATRGLDS